MTTEHEASRTLVKSPPELWAECSDPGSLARHLGEFGEITITRLEPENAVAWEGEHASGTVRIEPSGWGTRVTLTAQTKGDVAPAEPLVAEPEPEELAEEITLDPDPPVAPAGSKEREPEPPKEVDDATLEETLEDPEPQPVAEADRAPGRWRRMTARVRRAFRGDEVSVEAASEPAEPAEPAEPQEPEEREEPAASVPPPELHFASEPSEPEPQPQPALEAPAQADPAPSESLEPEVDAAAVLTAALDSLGQAHHRPFSRA